MTLDERIVAAARTIVEAVMTGRGTLRLIPWRSDLSTELRDAAGLDRVDFWTAADIAGAEIEARARTAAPDWLTDPVAEALARRSPSPSSETRP